MDDEVRGLVMRKADSATIRRACTSHGMKLLRQDGAERVIAGQTTIEELLRVTQEDTCSLRGCEVRFVSANASIRLSWPCAKWPQRRWGNRRR